MSSFSFNKRNNSELKLSQSKKKEDKIINPFNNKRNSPNINTINNMNLIPETTSSGNTNITVIKEKEKVFDLSYNSFPIKQLEKSNIEDFFLKKNKKIFESPKILNNKKITFQRQKDKTILEFDLFDDKLIFKDINKAYLQDEHNDDGGESPSSKINLGKSLLFQELDQASKELKDNLINNNNNNKAILSRKIKFNINTNK